MREWLFSLAVALLIAIAGYGGYRLGAVSQAVEIKDLQTTQTTDNQRDSLALQDHDYLVKMFRSTDDKGVDGIAFQWSDPSGKTDYKAVVRAFVEKELKKEIRSFQTVSRSVNPRVVLVTTTDGAAIEIQMKKLNNLGQMWTITGYNELYPTSYPASAERYRAIRIEEAPAQVQEWANKRMSSPEWKKEWLQTGEKTYVLLKTSGSPTDAVELEDVGFGAGEMSVMYQTFDYSQTSDPALINDYILLEVDYAAEQGVNFIESYTFHEARQG
ncbi:hypothetical protein ACFSO0_12065 [Brevibacillus sp. GCM10020057]|uniref:hypothetical protein n=1 Tax=Brevibacillus sp. GCM10020057 TaxID=3317327 RepID=UPI00362C9D9C